MDQFVDEMGLVLTSQGAGEADVECTVRANHLNVHKICHGGVLMTMADLAMGAASYSVGATVVTMDMQYRFLASPKQGEHVVAHGKVVKNGHRIVTTEATLHVGDKLIGHSTGQFYRLPSKDPEQQARDEEKFLKFPI